MLAALAVALGAFGAHGLETLISQQKILAERSATWHTAVQYHIYHAFALFITALAHPFLKENVVRNAFRFFLIGILLFSGSLYLLVISPLLFGTEISWLGAITPLGGLCFIAGWLFLFFAARFKKV